MTPAKLGRVVAILDAWTSVRPPGERSWTSYQEATPAGYQARDCTCRLTWLGGAAYWHGDTLAEARAAAARAVESAEVPL